MKCTLQERCTTTHDKITKFIKSTRQNAKMQSGREIETECSIKWKKKAHEKSIFQPNQNWNSRSLGTLKCYLYISIIICRFTAPILPSFCLESAPFFLLLYFIGLFHFFWLLFSFLFYRHVLASLLSLFLLLLFTLSSFKQIRLLVRTIFFMLFQFNGYFLLLLMVLLQNSNSAKSIRKKMPIDNSLAWHRCCFFFFFGYLFKIGGITGMANKFSTLITFFPST